VFTTPTFNVQLEVTTRCNDDCLFCPRAQIIKKGIRTLADAPLDLFSLIVPQLAEFKLNKVVVISGLGEPFLYSQLNQVLQMFKKLGKTVYLGLNTNGILLEGPRAECLIGSNVDALRVALNLATQAAFKKFRRSGDFNKVRDNIIKFLKLKGSRKPRVRVRINHFDVNDIFLNASRRFWSKHLNKNDVFELGGFSNWAGKIDRASWVERPLQPRKPCKYLWTHLTVNLEGDVFPCCIGIAETRDCSLFLGNINEGPTLLELYNGARLKELRLLHQRKDYPFPCSLCDSYGPSD